MTGGNQRTPSRPPGQPELFTIWALHEKVPRGWQPIVTGLAGDAAVAELTRRQDVVRRRDEPCRLILLPDDARPPQ